MNVYMDRTMPTKLDHKMLTGFTQEAQSYLPTIRAGLESFLHEAHQNEALEAAYQHVHAIKGAAEMLELIVLSQVTSYIQEMLGGDSWPTKAGGANTRRLLTSCHKPS